MKYTIRPLVWESSNEFEAHTSGLIDYEIEFIKSDNEFELSLWGEFIPKSFDSLENAKNFANEHYTRIMMSGLVPVLESTLNVLETVNKDRICLNKDALKILSEAKRVKADSMDFNGMKTITSHIISVINNYAEVNSDNGTRKLIILNATKLVKQKIEQVKSNNFIFLE